MRVIARLLVVTLITVSGAACAKARAATEPPMPDLIPPPPPPRVVERYPDPVPTIEPGPVQAALTSPPPSKPAAPPAAKPEPPKPEPPRVEPIPVNNPPALTLKPAPGVAAQTEASIRAMLDSAQKNLLRVNYPALDADGRAQFDIARGFMSQAFEALKSNNLAFAGKLADKAAQMAEVLVR
jgi:hypothetical protein